MVLAKYSLDFERWYRPPVGIARKNVQADLHWVVEEEVDQTPLVEGHKG